MIAIFATIMLSLLFAKDILWVDVEWSPKWWVIASWHGLFVFGFGTPSMGVSRHQGKNTHTIPIFPYTQPGHKNRHQKLRLHVHSFLAKHIGSSGMKEPPQYRVPSPVPLQTWRGIKYLIFKRTYFPPFWKCFPAGGGLWDFLEYPAGSTWQALLVTVLTPFSPSFHFGSLPHPALASSRNSLIGISL